MKKIARHGLGLQAALQQAELALSHGQSTRHAIKWSVQMLDATADAVELFKIRAGAPSADRPETVGEAHSALLERRHRKSFSTAHKLMQALVEVACLGGFTKGAQGSGDALRRWSGVVLSDPHR